MILGGHATRVLKDFPFRLMAGGLRLAAALPAALLEGMRSGVLPVKDRHVYTRSGRLRLRYVALMATSFLGIAATNLSFVPHQGFEIAQAQAGFADIPVAAVASADVSEQRMASLVPQLPAMAPVAPAKPVLPHPASYTRSLKIRSGDTLSDLMQQASVTGGEAAEAVSALKKHLNPKELKAGQGVTVHYAWNPQDGERMTAMEFEPTPLTRVVLSQGARGVFKAEKQQKELKSEVRAARATITSSLYGDLQHAGVPESIIAEFIKVYSYNVDFQRDIWAGDKVEILYDVNRTEDGRFVRGETLMYAMLSLRGKPNVIVRFNNKGQIEYFDGNGDPIKKALMRTPIDGARVTSGFGMRRHPLLGYTKMHKGMDFGAPTGTPIFAAGDGVITRAGWANGYGNFVSIKHNGTYATAYGHMSKILVSAGQRVRQGQVIGRVGSTGNSTGPHLHFEVLQAGTQVNPSNVANLSIGNKLMGKQLALFQRASASAKAAVQSLVNGGNKPQLASLDAQDAAR